MVNHLERVTKSLSKLSEKELLQVKAHVHSLLEEHSFKNDDWLLQGYRYVCKRSGVKSSYSVKDEAYHIYKNTSEPVKQVFLNAIANEGVINEIQLLALGRTLSRALFEFCSLEFNLPLSMNVLMSRTPLLIQAFERSFPGYLESKILLKWVCAKAD